MEQGCPHRSILPHIFPDCNSFAIKIGGKFCGVRGVCPGGGLPRRCRLGGRQRYPAGGAGGQSPTNPAFSFAFAPIPPPALAERSSRREGGDYRLFFARGCAPCIPGAEPTRHWFALPLWKTQWGLAPALPARRASAVPGGGVCPLCRLLTLPLWCPRGGVPALSPVNPAFNLLPCPPSPEGKDRPPTPFPAGRGRFFVFLCKGLRPLHPRG